MVPASLFEKYQKIWAMILGDSIFLLYLVYSTDLNIHCSRPLSYHFKFRIVLCIYLFMHYKISTGVVCVNGKLHPRSEVLSTPQIPNSPLPTHAPVPAVFSLLILRCFNSAHY